MGKPLVNTKQWTRNDIRMLIILQFVIVYPVLAGSLFMALLFFVLPRNTIWPHAYWLIASGAWMLLLAIILPLMKDKDDYYEPNIGPQKQHQEKSKDDGSTEKTPMMTQVRFQAAENDSTNRDSILTNRSSHKSEDESSDGVCDSENIRKPMHNIFITDSLHRRGSVFESDEFLNDCVGGFGDDTKKQDNADVLEDDNKKQYNSDVLENDNKMRDNVDVLQDDNKKHVKADVHLQNNANNNRERNSTENESKDDDSDIEMINEIQDMNRNIGEGMNEESRPDAVNYNKSNNEDSQNTDSSNTENIESQIHHTTGVVSPASSKFVVKRVSQEDIIVVDDEEVGELSNVPSLAQRRSKPDPIVDTSLANESYLHAANLDRRPSNTVGTPTRNVVHLFVQGNSNDS